MAQGPGDDVSPQPPEAPKREGAFAGRVKAKVGSKGLGHWRRGPGTTRVPGEKIEVPAVVHRDQRYCWERV